MGKIFVSYSTHDKFFSELLTLKLVGTGIDVWRDVTSIKAGEEWRAAIDQGIRESFALVLALSPSSNLSQYVTYEWASALGQGKPLIPILLSDCDRHPRIEPIQYIDFRHHSEETWQRLVQRLKETQADAEQSAAIVGAEDDVSANKLTKVTLKEQKAKNSIKAYLQERGFSMMSYERVRERINSGYDDAFLKALVAKVDEFAPAVVRGGKLGLRLR